ncbi:MAG: SDR family oxidoreductase [Betaproteobacteria bacterium]|nr:SDR family oxidoreductase [Betaproteobacteria bacterium]
MGMLQGKRILITGLIGSRSIAYGIARACRDQGAELAFTYQNERVRDRVADLASEFQADMVLPCDVADDAQIEALFAAVSERWNTFDGLVHSIAFAPREALMGDFLDGLTREAFHQSQDISAYSFPALARGARRFMRGRDSAMLTLSYLGAERVVPNYNAMGLAKASLEASVRYMAAHLGADGIRVNGISAGPIKTLAAAGIGNFGRIFKFVEENAPIRRNVSIDDVGKAAAFLLSDFSSGVTGEILHVDGGFSTVMAGIRGDNGESDVVEA